MELGLTPGQERFRRRLRDLFAGPEMAGPLAQVRASLEEGEPDPRPVYRVLGRLGLLAADWPVELGGGGRTPVEQSLVVEELVRHGVPETLHTLSVQIVGRAVRLAGSAAQKASLLPRLARARAFATVLYSEPEAGSDLAALVARGERRPDGGFALHGRKVYSLYSRLAQVGLCAVRTSDEGSRYAGITLFLLPLDAPGVTVGLIDSVADEAFCAVELDGAVAGEDAVLGEVGQAWSLVTRALTLERTGVDHAARCRRLLELLVAANPGDDPVGLGAVGRLGADAEASRLLSWTVLHGLEAGRADEAGAAAAKWYASEAARRGAWQLAESLGPAACLHRSAPDAPLDGAAEAAYRDAPGLTISAGTSEMMLELVSGSGLAEDDGGADGLLDPLQRQLQRALRRLLEREAEPEARWAALAELGTFGLAVPVEAGGLDLGQGALTVVGEEMGRALAAGAGADTLTAADCLALAGRDGPCWERLPELAAGRLAVSLAVAEGRTERSDGGWSLTGRAGFVESAQRADSLLVVAPVDGGGRAFLVPTASAGWSLRPLPAIAPVELFALRFEGLPLADRHEVGPACPGGLPERVRGRAWMRGASSLVGLAAGALQLTVERARERRQFGRALIDNQAVAFRLAALRCRLEAARLLARHAAWRDDAGQPALPAAAEALAHAAELALDVTREGMQLHGAFGSTRAAAIQRYYRRALVDVQRAGGTAALWREAGRRRAAEVREPA